MKSFLYNIWSKFLTFFGDIKIFKYPLWVVYDPFYFKMTGEKILEAVELLEPGDVILRKYTGYLDSKFINGEYSHGAIYIGDNSIIHAVAPKVEQINVVEFMECDGIAIYRPKKYKKSAVKNAKKFLKDGIDYDFLFHNNVEGNKDNNALYCFELVASCFPKLKIPTFTIKKFFGLIKKEVYLSQSFNDCKDFELIFEYNPTKNVDYRKD